MKILNATELEKILIANWTAFLNPREMIKFTTEALNKKNINGPITSLVVTRFEATSAGFLIWIELKTSIRLTIEALLSLNGEISHIRTEIT